MLSLSHQYPWPRRDKLLAPIKDSLHCGIFCVVFITCVEESLAISIS
jgi:hypothetical protein